MEFIFSANKNEDQSSISQNDEEFTCKPTNEYF